MFTQMLEHTMTVRRLQPTTGVKRVYSEMGPYPCNLQPLDDRQNDLHGLALGYGFYLYCDVDTDVKDGDAVVVNGQELKVSGMKVYNFGIHQHKELLVISERAPSDG